VISHYIQSLIKLRQGFEFWTVQHPRRPHIIFPSLLKCGTVCQCLGKIMMYGLTWDLTIHSGRARGVEGQQSGGDGKNEGD